MVFELVTFHSPRPFQLTRISWKIFLGRCARYSGSMVKLIGASSSFIQEAEEACVGVPHGCGSMVTFAIASLGYLAENVGRSYYECPYYLDQNLYQCGQDQSKMATAIERFASAMAAAILNCGPFLGNLGFDMVYYGFATVW